MAGLTFAEHTPPASLGLGKSYRALVETDSLAVSEVFCDAGVVSESHSHGEEQAAYHVSGRFELDLDGRAVTVGPGDGYSIPAGARHSVRCIETGSYVLITARGRTEHDHHRGDEGHQEGKDADHG